MYSKHYIRKMLCLATYIVIITREKSKIQSEIEYNFTKENATLEINDVFRKKQG